MVSFFVVFKHPGPAQLANLIEISEQPGIEHLGSVGSAKSFDESVLVRLARFDVVDQDPVGFTPINENIAEEFGTVVRTKYVRLINPRPPIAGGEAD